MKLVFVTLLLVFNPLALMVMAQSLETQKYNVIKTIGSGNDQAEIRYYPPAMKIQSDNDFGVLFRYISGKNAGSTKISMTTPVYMGDEEGNNVMEFVLPENFTKDNTPGALSSDVRVFESEPGYMLALEFGGYASENSREKYTDKLLTLAREQGLQTIGEPMLLVYNSPYQFFNRKNEIVIGVQVQE